MPFHSHNHSTSSSAHQNAPSNVPGTASGIYQAAQTLGAIGAPGGSLRIATSGPVGPASTDGPYSSGGHTTTLSGGVHTTSVSGLGMLPSPAMGASISAPVSAATSRPFDAPRRANTLARQSEELHLLSAPMGSAQQGGYHQQSPRTQQHHSHQLSQDYTAGTGPPHISLHQATPSNSSYANLPSGSGHPGSLQPGSSSRPLPLSTNTAPAAVPTIPQIQTQMQQYVTGPRPANLSHSHSYSRSSPSGGLDSQKYVPYPGTPETAKYPHTNPKYTPTQSQGAISSSPLGLADIRPRAGSGFSDGPTSANPYSYDEDSFVSTDSSYQAPWAIYAFDWCKWPVHNYGGGNGAAGKVAVGSYLEDGHNYIQILDTEIAHASGTEGLGSGTSPYRLEFVKLAEATHPYPVTRILWEPPSSTKQSTDLLATSGDHLRLWSLPGNVDPTNSNSITRTSNSRDPASSKLTPLALLSNSKSPEHTAPLTSLDWNTLSPSLIITSSIDTTCTIWDIPTLTAKTQLIAHDKEVFDVRFCANSVDVFVSCGADGSVRMFDLRSLEHSTIIYEPTDKLDKGKATSTTLIRVQTLTSLNPGSGAGNISPTTAQQTMSYAPPLLRLSASPHDAHLLATFSQDSNIIRILDVRQPGQALLELRGHASSVNCIEWSPSRRGMLASGADDSLVLVWDLLSQSNNSALLPASSMNGVQGQAGAAGADIGRGPSSAWRCEFEVNNISWAPPSVMTTSQGADWLGVAGGRGISGVRL
ncbi:MAG: hypothetical protein M1816_006192 [Peltula sp. TS41687]|nr:MAG: hypothetical protein M1816_006192 [Peltula sp. TS41687]